MPHEELERKKQQLIDIQKITNPAQRIKDLQKLAKEVGASIRNPWKAGLGQSGEPELIENIERSLQTATMIDMCKTSAKNYKIAITAAIIALLSALAAWVAVVVAALTR